MTFFDHKKHKASKKLMYKVYILKRRKKGAEAVQGTKTYTASLDVAEVAFLTLRKMKDFQGGSYILLMTFEGKQLKAHRFDVGSEHETYYPLNELEVV